MMTASAFSSLFCDSRFYRRIWLLAILFPILAAISCQRVDRPADREQVAPQSPPAESPHATPNQQFSFKILGGWPAPGVTGSEYYQSLEGVKEKIRAHAKKASDLPGLYGSTVIQKSRTSYLEFNKDTVIADIGCGTGAMEVVLLLSGKPFKHIYAVDPEPNSLEILKFLLDEYFPEEKSKITIVQSTASNVMLPTQMVDLAILNDVHFFVRQMAVDDESMSRAVACLKSLHEAMKPDGSVFVRQSSPYLRDWSTGETEIVKQPNVRNELDDIAQTFQKSGFTVAVKTVDRECHCYALTLKP